MNNILPKPSSRIQKASFGQLIYQGLFLHFASFWGPLRVSKQFRLANKNWVFIVFDRWFKEYGLNLVVSLLFLSSVFVYSNELPLWAFGVSLLIAPSLTVIQMFIDSMRKEIIVLFDTEHKSGVTVRSVTNQDGVTQWSFYNHFALPIGDKKGIYIRGFLHEQAQGLNFVLACHAQSETIASYYLSERVTGKNYGGGRPLIVWDYNGNYDDINKEVNSKQTHIFRKLFGFDSNRNSGQVPLKFALS